MPRKQNKIQGVVSDEMLEQWQQWKEQQGFKSDGQALNALLVQLFSSGETDITSDQALRDRIEQLEQQISQISNLSKIQDDLSQKGKQIEALEEKLKDLEQQRDPDLENGLFQKDLAIRWNLSTRAISDAKKKDQKDWEAYCKKKDPDGLVWHLSGRKYYPAKQS